MGDVVLGEAPETDIETESDHEKWENDKTSDNVVVGEASESEDDIGKTSASSAHNSGLNKAPGSAQNVVVDLKDDIIACILGCVYETQQKVAEELDRANAVLLSSQVTLQRTTLCLKSNASQSNNLISRFNNALSTEFIPKLYFK